MWLIPFAFAGAPAILGPVEGQRGLGPPVVSADGRRVALTRWDRSGLWVLEDGAVEAVSAARGAGFAPRWDGEDLYFKAVDPDLQRAMRWREGGLEELDAAPRLGQPVPFAGRGLWARPDRLQLEDEDHPGLGDVDLVSVDPRGRVAWNDDAGALHVRDLARGVEIDLGGLGTRPAWSEDGAWLLSAGVGVIRVVDPGGVDRELPGSNPAWIPGSHRFVYDRIQTGADLGPELAASPYEVVDASLWVHDADSGESWLLFADPALHPRWPSAAADGSVWFVDSIGGDLWRLHEGEARREAEAPADRVAPPSVGDGTEVWVPYMHQLWDTPDDFDGSWSCGPTSCVQTLGRWSILPNYDISCSWPWSHTSHWGWYINNAYSYGGYTYDTWGVAAGGDCQGAHGYICLEYGGAVWNQMTAFMSQHGVSSSWAGTSFDTVVSEVQAGYPLYASVSVLGYGHIISVRGFLTSGGSPIHSIIVNDPYGNAGTGDWGNYDGERAVYDWPGYNNGYLEIGLSQLFTAHGPATSIDTDGEDPVPVDTGDPPVEDSPAPVDSQDSGEADAIADPPSASIGGTPGEWVPLYGEGCRTAPSSWAALGGLALLLRRRRAG